MKRILLICLGALLAAAFSAQAGTLHWPGRTIAVTTDYRQQATGENPRRNNTDEIIFEDDFENGFQWTTHDMTADPGAWHTDAFNAYGGSGLSWWCSDPQLGGYRDDWYMALDTPPIDLTGAISPTLSFQSRYACETPDAGIPPWDGWDGMNIRISTDNGDSWTILGNDVIIPDYTVNSLYGFGLQHGEGPNIPGWAGQSTAWQQVTADLSAYADEIVQIRFAFASDADISTTMYPAWFGWQVDEIDVSDSLAQIFHNTGDDPAGFESINVHQIGGDLWHVETWTTPAPPSPTHVLRCGNIGGSYNPNMNNAVISPYIDLTPYVAGSCNGDFMVMGDISDAGPSPNIDYWYVEISPDSGVHWYNVTNPWGDPGGDNYVFNNVLATWSSFVNTYNFANLDFTPYFGHVCQFRIVMESDADVPTGIGILIDNVWINYETALPNDCGCTSLHIPFPTSVGFQTHGEAEFSNLGLNEASPVFARWGVEGSPPIVLTPNMTLGVGVTETRTFDWTPTTTGTYWHKTWTDFYLDENRLNDTCAVFDVVVTPHNELVLGYDSRTFQWRYNYETGQGAACRFTPGDDGITGAFNVREARFLFDSGQEYTENFDLVIFEGNETETPGSEIATVTVAVQPILETNPNWKTVDLSNIPELQGRTGNFWFWLKVTNTSSGDRYPEILGNDQVWGDSHFFVYDGAYAQASASDYLIHATVNPSSGVNDKPIHPIPETFRLEQNYPNPFNPTTTIRFDLPYASQVALTVFNLLGQQVATLVDRKLEAGGHRVEFNAADLPSGVYFYRIEASNFVDTKKMVVLK
jgi:hypothetical protein